MDPVVKKMRASDRLIYLNALREGGIDAIFLPSEGSSKRAHVIAPDLDSKPAKLVATPAQDGNASDVRDQMINLRDKTHACTLCPELATTRNKVVFGSGNTFGLGTLTINDNLGRQCFQIDIEVQEGIRTLLFVFLTRNKP